MESRDLIPIELVCEHYKVPVAFINSLQEFQLIELTVENNVFFIHKAQVKEVEKIARLHYDLEINIEGIDAIYNLLLKGKGFPKYKKEGVFGDLYITYQIKLPTKLSNKEKELIKQLQTQRS